MGGIFLTEFFHTFPPYNLWALRKVIVYPVNVEGSFVWGHPTFSCCLVFVCGLLGWGPQTIKNPNRERLISNFKYVGKDCRVSEIKWLLGSKPPWGQELNLRLTACFLICRGWKRIEPYTSLQGSPCKAPSIFGVGDAEKPVHRNLGEQHFPQW